MNKKEQLLKQANELIKKAREIESIERQKVGKLVLSMYEKGEIKDSELRATISSIVGDQQHGSASRSNFPQESNLDLNNKE